jgi:predicted nucleic acid-binding protein
MSVDAVFDTNILIYAASRDPKDVTKSKISLKLMQTVAFGVPLQVIQEFFHNTQRKARLGIEPRLCDSMVAMLLDRPIVITDIDLFAEARSFARRYEISYWDAAIVAATHRLNASLLYSEDLSHGQQYGKVKVINPFLAKH